jgi:hypothetical protein
MNILRKGLTVAVILLFISVSISTSASNKITDENIYDSSLEVKENLEKTSKFQTTVYGFLSRGPHGPCFFANYPNNTMKYREWEGWDFFSAGTWTNDGRFLCCLYKNGTLYDVDPETLEPTAIGNGGNGLNGLAFDPDNEKLYGASSSSLFLIDIETGCQEYIGDFGISSSYAMIGIAVTSDGIMYGWDVKFSGDSYLYKIDKETGEATQLFSLEVTLLYAQDGDFYRIDGLLYLSANIAEEHGGYLCKVNIETEEFTIIGMFENGINPTAYAISYDIDFSPPVTTISFDPPYPNGLEGWYVSNVTVTLNATDDMSGVKAIYFKIPGGVWKNYTGDYLIFTLDQDCLIGLIEFYSVDYAGNQENIKSVNIKIDQLPPEETIEIKSHKKDGKWYVNFIVNDTDACSGIYRLELYINDNLWDIITDDGPPYVFEIEWSKVMRKVTFTFVVFDKAGWYTEISVNGSDIEPHPKCFAQNSNFILFQGWLIKFLLLERLAGRLTWLRNTLQ